MRSTTRGDHIQLIGVLARVFAEIGEITIQRKKFSHPKMDDAPGGVCEDGKG